MNRIKTKLWIVWRVYGVFAKRYTQFTHQHIEDALRQSQAIFFFLVHFCYRNQQITFFVFVYVLADIVENDHSGVRRKYWYNNVNENRTENEMSTLRLQTQSKIIIIIIIVAILETFIYKYQPEQKSNNHAICWTCSCVRSPCVACVQLYEVDMYCAVCVYLFTVLQTTT